MENPERGKQSLKIAKGVIKSRISKKDRQFNGLREKNKQKTIDLATLF